MANVNSKFISGVRSATLFWLLGFLQSEYGNDGRPTSKIQHHNLFPHPGWIAARAHQGKMRICFVFFRFFRSMKKWPRVAPNGTLETFFLLIQTLSTFWAERIWILRTFIFLIFWNPHFWISRSAYLQNSRFPGPQISKFPDFQVPRFPNFQTPLAAAAPDELSDPNLTPLPTHPGIKHIARSPCCDKQSARNCI